MASSDDEIPEQQPAPAKGTAKEAAHFFDAKESGFRGANEDEDALSIRLIYLEQEHRDLDDAIRALSESPGQNGLNLARMKKRKLALKDAIKALKDQLTPDIIA
ncbi:MAG: DUF465 domain-containing protein [Parvularculaceae bacterium]